MTERNLSSIVTQGDRRESLEALRDFLVSRLESADGREVAAIAGRLVSVIDAIDAIPDPREGSVVDREADEVAAQRAKRQRRPDAASL